MKTFSETLESLNTERAYKRSAVCTLFASFAPIMAAFCNGHYRYKYSINPLLSAFKNDTNLLLTEREGRTGEYWPEVVTVRTERSRP